MSGREREVLARLVRGASGKAIAVQLGITTSSVQSYLERLCEKTGARNRVHLACLATGLHLSDGATDDSSLP